jgi:dGTPase
MDWADDVAYSVHDLEDFHRCGAIPWRRILAGDRSEPVVERAKKHWLDHPLDADGRLREALRRLDGFLSGFSAVVDEIYEGSVTQRQQLRTMTSRLIARYMKAIELVEPSGFQADMSRVAIGAEEGDEVRILKQITRDYVISTPALIAQQKGQAAIINNLFETFMQDSQGENYPSYLPVRLRYLWKIDGQETVLAPRFAADCIASLTEHEAVGLHSRLTGIASGSVLDPIIR